MGLRLKWPNRTIPRIVPTIATTTDGDREDQRGTGAQARRLQDRRRVVVHGVDAGRLLHRGQTAPDPQDPAHPGEGPQVTYRRTLVLGGVPLGVLGDDGELLGRLGVIAAEAQYPAGVVQPSREPRTSAASRAGRTCLRTEPTAGMIATASIHRHTCGSLIVASSSALIANARNCPVTIMSSLIVTMRPRRCAGAISARYSGHVVAAAPTPKPSRMRPMTMMATVGAVAQISAPNRNSPAQTSRLPLRPSRSASLPPSSAPNAAPGNSSELTTSASVNGRQVQVRLHVQQRARDHARVVAEQQAAERGNHRELDEKSVVRT